MDLELKGKVVFIPGGSKGIGLACARAFAQEGARVAIAGRSRENLQAAVSTLEADGLNVHAECADAGDIEMLQQAVDRVEDLLGPIEVRVNCAGAASHYPRGSTDPLRWDAGMQSKYFPAVHGMDVVIPRMAERGGGVVVNIVGIGGRFPDPMHMPGGAANAALLLVSSAMAKAWGHRGVRVNAINPGPTETDRVSESLRVRSEASGKSIAEIRLAREAGIPLRRYGTPKEVASMAVFLASPRVTYVTGASIAMDGGANAVP